ncbi:MAG TPA: RNA polymerase factor sigma-54 [Candidatus Omnitrophota bacterium]|nr:RNA polymerase factor sigma-54 [Candidatus Omnitrophota bacterium]
MNLKQTQIQVQKQILAPLMQQSIEVLLLPMAELEQTIEQELEKNPLLEADPTETEDLKDARAESPLEASLQNEIDQLLESGEYHFFSQSTEEQTERPIKSHESLETKLLQQLHSDFSDPLKIKIGELIIGDLDDDGYLTVSCEEIAEMLGLADIDPVLEVLKVIQGYEPVGIASRDLKECLMTQAKFHFNGHAQLSLKIIDQHLDDLGHKRFQDIARSLGVSVDCVRSSAQLITALDPRPARNHRPLPTNHYVRPDIVVRKDQEDNERLIVEVNERGLPRLRINSLYRELLNRENLSDKERAFIKEKLTEALQFIRSIEQRGSTIKRIAEFILEQQKDFFEHGHMSLKPMTLRDVASALDRNESTICRAIHNKYMDTPQGVIPLKYFFSQSVGRVDAHGGQAVSNRSIKEELQDLIEHEDKRHPLSDQEIIDELKKRGIKVARRTITKYRKQLNILPSHLRKI